MCVGECCVCVCVEARENYGDPTDLVPQGTARRLLFCEARLSPGVRNDSGFEIVKAPCHVHPRFHRKSSAPTEHAAEQEKRCEDTCSVRADGVCRPHVIRRNVAQANGHGILLGHVEIGEGERKEKDGSNAAHASPQLQAILLAKTLGGDVEVLVDHRKKIWPHEQHFGKVVRPRQSLTGGGGGRGGRGREKDSKTRRGRKVSHCL